jgi:hypothetical protein
VANCWVDHNRQAGPVARAGGVGPERLQRRQHRVALQPRHLSQPPHLGNRKVWVALSVDGKPLPEDEGPVRLLIPGEGTGHYHRWLFGIATITRP